MPNLAHQTAGKKVAEAKFSYCVDVRIPAEGLGRVLASMLDWCQENLAPDAWEVHFHSEPHTGPTPADYVRFYFTRETDATAFRIVDHRAIEWKR